MNTGESLHRGTLPILHRAQTQHYVGPELLRRGDAELQLVMWFIDLCFDWGTGGSLPVTAEPQRTESGKGQ